MKGIAVFALVCLVGLPIAGCSQATGSGSSSASTDSSKNNSPKGTRLAKVKPGMSRTKVRAIMGSPKETTERMTGKAWIPWYFGEDRRVSIYFYPKQGRVFFGNTGFAANTPGDVLYVEYDKGEDGFADTN